jgi:hypothetical protein
MQGSWQKMVLEGRLRQPPAAEGCGSTRISLREYSHQPAGVLSRFHRSQAFECYVYESPRTRPCTRLVHQEQASNERAICIRRIDRIDPSCWWPCESAFPALLRSCVPASQISSQVTFEAPMERAHVTAYHVDVLARNPYGANLPPNATFEYLVAVRRLGAGASTTVRR